MHSLVVRKELNTQHPQTRTYMGASCFENVTLFCSFKRTSSIRAGLKRCEVQLFSVKPAMLLCVHGQHIVDNSSAGPNWEELVQLAQGRSCLSSHNGKQFDLSLVARCKAKFHCPIQIISLFTRAFKTSAHGSTYVHFVSTCFRHEHNRNTGNLMLNNQSINQRL